MPKAKAKKPGMEVKICEAALRLAARRGWNCLTMDEIARAAKIPPMQASKLFGGKDDILPVVMRMIDDRMVATTGKPDLNAAPRDRLFEVIMVRLDLLQEYRPGILAIMDELKNNPGLIRRLLLAEITTLRTIVKLAGLKPPRLQEPLIIAGLLGIYAWTLCAWRKDASPDMAKTMATLDRCLRQAAFVMETVLHRYP